MSSANLTSSSPTLLSPPPVTNSQIVTQTPSRPAELDASTSTLPNTSSITTSSSTRQDHDYPPIPPYSLHPPNDIPISITAPSPPPEGADTGESDLQQYIMAHDHGGAGVSRRLPEAFPVDLLSLRSSQGPPETLPAYGSNDPPSYRRPIENAPAEPQTLAMHFFKFGFFFPAFWVFGALMLITPLRSPNPLSPVAQLSVWPPNTAFVEWCNENVRTEEDKREFLAKMHEVEIKWARRCLIALGMLACFGVAVGVTIFAVLKAQ